MSGAALLVGSFKLACTVPTHFNNPQETADSQTLASMAIFEIL